MSYVHPVRETLRCKDFQEWSELMTIALSLLKAAEQLGGKHNNTKRLIKQVYSGFSVYLDMQRAQQMFVACMRHRNAVLGPMPVEQHGEQGLIGAGLFYATMMHLCRALDVAGKGRNRMDFSKAFENAGLSDNAREIDAFRNAEFAHFGGYTHLERPFTNIDILLQIDDDGVAWPSYVFHVWNSYGRSAHFLPGRLKQDQLSRTERRDANTRHRMVNSAGLTADTTLRAARCRSRLGG